MTHPVRLALFALVAHLSILATGGMSQAGHVWNDPYAGVDWQAAVRLKTQFHDHVMTDSDRITAYDTAGYDVVPLMHYSGDPSRSYAWTERHWPPEDWLSADFLVSLENIDFFIPGAEEISGQHLTSPFLTTYIEWWRPSVFPQDKETHHYEKTQEAIDLIRSYGGIPILCHPWGGAERFLTDYHAVEMYSAYAEFRTFNGYYDFDASAVLYNFWDARLRDNPTLYGIAVNDWYGAFAASNIQAQAPTIIDSGKTIVLSNQTTPEAFREAVENGAMLAVSDMGVTKDAYPHIESILVDADTIAIDTTDDVLWI